MRIPALFLCIALSLSVSASDGITLRDAFRQMPDSLMPTLTQNNRLDCLDFLDAGMKAEVRNRLGGTSVMTAEVRNRLGGTSVMTALTPDSLSLQVSPALRVDMLLLPLAEPIDTVDYVIVVGETFLVDSIYGETTLRYFTPTWQPIPVPPLSESQQKRIAGFSLQTILKWSDELIKKVNIKI